MSAPHGVEERTYDADTSLKFLASMRELWAFREMVWAFGMRRIRTRYKQAIFGFAWAVAQPLVFLGAFLFFLRDAVGDGADSSYAAGSYASLIAWQFGSAAILAAGTSLVNESGIIRKVYFPREGPVLGAAGAYLPDLVINLVLLAVIAPVIGGQFSAAWLWAVLPILSLVMTSIAIGLPLAALSVRYRDILYALPIAVQLLLFATPLAYSVEGVDERWQLLYAALNPLVGPIAGFRRIFGEGQPPLWDLFLVSSASGGALLIVGYLLFKKLEPSMADVI